MAKYIAPELKIVVFDTADVIDTSTPLPDDDFDNGNG